MMPQNSLYRTALLVLLVLLSFQTIALPPGKKDEPEKVSKVGEYQGYSEATYKGFSYSSLYITMRDSVQIATDVFLPKGLKDGEKVPTILYITRYVRSLKAKWPISWLKNPVLVIVAEEEVK